MEEDKEQLRAIEDIIEENARRNAELSKPFNPVSGEGSIGERFLFILEDYPIREQWLPMPMAREKLVRTLAKCGSISKFLTEEMGVEDVQSERLKVMDAFVRLRCLHDFPFWAAMFVMIKRKGGGEDVPFILTNPQRKFVSKLEEKRLANKPIRIILLKARQWGGSTTSQLYMAWFQLVHKRGLNSLIIAHQGSASEEIKDMFDRMINSYPTEMLYQMGESFPHNVPKLEGVGKSGSTHRVPQRNFKIKIGTAEKPDSCRGGDYNLVHLSEVGIWKATDGKTPEDIVASACSGIQLRPYTMIVYESTAKGSDNFFHREYMAAKSGLSQFEAIFISWYEIEWNVVPLEDEYEFAKKLYANRHEEDAKSMREEPGIYLWNLWKSGATLEAINWYITERSGKPAHEIMASESPSDDVEAFTYSGANVFDRYQIEKLKETCKPPLYIGEITGKDSSGPDALKYVKFHKDSNGRLSIWALPEIDPEEKIAYRYLTVVDIGVGRTAKSDFSVITVFDRLGMVQESGKPTVVAQWHGHKDMDLLAWKSAQIAHFYDHSLLVIESNSLETHAIEGKGADHSGFILNLIADSYNNLYYRHQAAEDIREGIPRKYGFHTNIATKVLVIDGLQRAVREGLWVERDEGALAEFLSYVQTKRGTYEASPGCHDDRLMTRAIGLHICFKEMPLPRPTPRQNKVSNKKKAISAATI